MRDPSLLRFLVDMRDADLGDRQLRDDLMTMLIAGHETTAAVPPSQKEAGFFAGTPILLSPNQLL